MEHFLEAINQRIVDLKQIMKEKEAALLDAPDGTISIHQKGNRIQYYHKDASSNLHRTYLKNSEKKLAEALCQKDYNQKVLKAAEKELKQLERLKSNYPKETVEDIYETMNVHRRKLIQPIVIPDDEFIQNWEQVKYEGKGFRDEAPEYYTDNGERVRSKTEILIANALKKHAIPYRYEAPLYLNGCGMIHPDFTVLNVRLRKELFWEHMGMMDAPDYLDHALYRIGMYEKNDIFPGDRLILTHETSRYPINSRSIEKMIFQYLK